MPVTAAIDDNNATLPILRRKAGGAHNEAISSGNSTRIAIGDNVGAVSFWATGTCHVEFGDENVTADVNAHAWPAGIVDYENLRNNNKEVIATHVAVYATEDLTFHMSERE